MPDPKVTLRTGADRGRPPILDPSAPADRSPRPPVTIAAQRPAVSGRAPRFAEGTAGYRVLTVLGAVASSALAALLVAGLWSVLAAGETPMREREASEADRRLIDDRDERPVTTADDPVARPLLEPVQPEADARRSVPPGG